MLLRRNSEIYNHEEIKASGALQGVRITKDSKSDSAIIGHLYEKLVGVQHRTLSSAVQSREEGAALNSSERQRGQAQPETQP